MNSPRACVAVMVTSLLLLGAAWGCGSEREVPKDSPQKTTRQVAKAAPTKSGVGPRSDAGARRIAIIGDSITHGGETLGRFGITLAKKVGAGFPGSVVETHSVPGETCKKLSERFHGNIIWPRPGYDTVIIQCGTNDIFNGRGLKSTIDYIDTMIAWSLEAGMKVVLLGVGPGHGYKGWTDEKERKRVALNRWIGARADVIAVDVEAVVATGKPPRLRQEFYVTDYIHPNDKGLDALAEETWRVAFAGSSSGAKARD